MCYCRANYQKANIILRLLEEQGYVCCIGERDFVVGENVAQNIDQAIRSSEAVIFLLSKQFYESGWCKYEIEVANSYKVFENTRIIFLKLDDSRIPSSLIITTEVVPWYKFKPHKELEKTGKLMKMCVDCI